MAKVNEWFIGFLKSFKEGESRISGKQFDIFAKYLEEQFKDGYISGYRGKVDGYKIKAYRWDSKVGARYYVEKSRSGYTYSELLDIMERKGCNLAEVAIGSMMDIVETETGNWPDWSDIAPDWVVKNCCQ